MLRNLAVVNTLGYKDKGTLIAITENDKKKLVNTSRIVGYIVVNTGSASIQCLSEEFHMNSKGVYVGKVQTITILPRQSIVLRKKYMALLALQREIDMKFSNGKMIKGSTSKRYKDKDEELEAFHFVFNDKRVSVHSPSVKLPIAKKILTIHNGVTKAEWLVKLEFSSVFGYLDNEKE